MRKILVLLFAAALSAQYRPDDHPLFERDEVHEIHLKFAQPDWYEQLLRNFNGTNEDVPYIEASFRWRDVEFETVGVRIKGNSTARVNSVKRPFRIKLNEFVKGQKIKGIDSLNFNNSNGDASMVREKVYFELARDAGLKAARMNHAALYINGQLHGLYLLGEVINEDFVDDHFPKDERDGWLYKGDLGSTFEDRGDEPAPYRQTFEKKSREEEDDWSDLIKLVATLNRAPKEELKAKMEELLDMDSFLTAMALDNLTVNLDSYVGMAQNYYLYRRPTDNKFEWLPWDPSLAFGSFNSGLTTAQLTTLPLEWSRATAGAGAGPGGGFPPGGGAPPGGGPPPGGIPPGGIPPGGIPPGGIPPGGIPPGGAPPGGGGGFGSNNRPLPTKLWEIPEVKARYTAIYRRLASEVYFPDKIIARMNELRTLIRPYVERDANKLHTLAQFDNAMTVEGGGLGGPAQPGQPGQPAGGGGFGGGPALDPFVRERLDSVKVQLAER